MNTGKRRALARKTRIRTVNNVTGDSTQVDGYAGSVVFDIDGVSIRADIVELVEGRNRFRLSLTAPMWAVLKISARGANELFLEVELEGKRPK